MSKKHAQVHIHLKHIVSLTKAVLQAVVMLISLSIRWELRTQVNVRIKHQFQHQALKDGNFVHSYIMCDNSSYVCVSKKIKLPSHIKVIISNSPYIYHQFVTQHVQICSTTRKIMVGCFDILLVDTIDDTCFLELKEEALDLTFYNAQLF